MKTKVINFIYNHSRL